MAQLDILVNLAGLNQVLGGLGNLRTMLRSVSKAPGTSAPVAAAAVELGTMVQGLSMASRGLDLMAVALKQAADTAIEFANLRAVTGGTSKDAAFMAGMGLGPEAAASFRNALQTPFGRYAAMKTGVSPEQLLPPQLGTQNYAKGLRQFIEGLRQLEAMGQHEEALRRARMASQEQVIPLLQAGDRAWKNLMDSIERTNQAMQTSGKAAADLQANQKAFDNNVKALLAGADAVKGLNFVLEKMNQNFGAVQVFFRLMQDFWADWTEFATVNPFKGIQDMIRDFAPGRIQDLWEQMGKATAAQQNAANAMNNAANAMKPGQYGGGQRFRDAITGGFLNPSMDGWAFRAGAFGYVWTGRTDLQTPFI